MAVGRIFEQYSVICVFGSVVGCVVVPLIAQVYKDVIGNCGIRPIMCDNISHGAG